MAGGEESGEAFGARALGGGWGEGRAPHRAARPAMPKQTLSPRRSPAEVRRVARTRTVASRGEGAGAQVIVHALLGARGLDECVAILARDAICGGHRTPDGDVGVALQDGRERSRGGSRERVRGSRAAAGRHGGTPWHMRRLCSADAQGRAGARPPADVRCQLARHTHI